jgi:ribonuclease J
MAQNMDMAASLGYLKIPEGVRIRAEDIGNYAANEVTILTTGSQGEPLAGLSRMASDDHRQVRIQPGDTIILSATPIPGNEDAVWRVVNNLIARGADVIYDAILPVHVSGHGYAEELKLVLNIVNPQYVVPVHGEHRMMARYAKIAEEMGWLPEDIFRLDIGDVLELNHERGRIVDRVPSGAVLVDGSGTAGVHEVVLRDRQHLAEDGFVVVVVAMNRETGELVAGPDILSRGFVYMDHSEELMTEATDQVRDMLRNLPGEGPREPETIQSEIRSTVKKLFEKRTNRRPMILPLVMEY